MDIFRDYFTRENLVVALANTPYTPGRLGATGLFETVPLTSTTLAVEVGAKDAGRVMTAINRGAPRQSRDLDKRKVVTFSTSSYGDQGYVYADEALNGRGAGTNGAAEVILDRRNRLLARLRRDADYTHESQRVYTLVNPGSTEFGNAAASVVIAAQTANTKMRQEIHNKVISTIEAALDGIPYAGITVFCSPGYWSDLIEATAIKETYLNYQAAAELRGLVTQSFVFGGVTWERYRGTSTCKITDDEAIAVPTGVNGMFLQAFAPNDTMESAGDGALGQPYYLGAMPIKDSQGTKAMEVSIQSHPKFVCGLPGAVQRITKA
jgi:hypothetical protein